MAVFRTLDAHKFRGTNPIAAVRVTQALYTGKGGGVTISRPAIVILQTSHTCVVGRVALADRASGLTAAAAFPDTRLRA